MPQFLIEQLNQMLAYGWELASFFILFSLLSQKWPCNKEQPIIRKGMVLDATYGFLIPLASKFVFIFYISTAFGLFFYNLPAEQIESYLQNGHGYLSTLPLWLQAAIVFIVSDFLLYWTHRIFHNNTLWKWHAIHHSPKYVDFLTAYRFHPINIWLSFTLVNVIMILIGFSPASITIMSTFNSIYSAMVHANLNWTFGKFKYLFASPVFHRWHHTTQKEGLNKNFAPTFPLLDVMFGTFYMPEGKLPEKYGVLGSNIPESLAGQLVWPLKK